MSNRARKAGRQRKRPAFKHSLRQPSARQQTQKQTTQPAGRWNWNVTFSLIAAIAALGGVAMNHFSNQTAQQNADIARHAEFENRFNNAIQNLGAADSIAVRVGGVLQLNSLLEDSPRYSTLILDQLSSFIRHRAPLSECTEKQTPSDVQEALTVIGENISAPNKASREYSTDLSRTCLRNARMSNLIFPRANFTYSDFNGADLSGAEMPGSVFFKANLNEILSIEGDFTCALLTNSSIQNARMIGVKLTGADLMASNLEGTAFAQVDMTNATLEGANLSEGQLSGLTRPLTRPQPYCFPPDQYGPMFGPF